MKKLLIATLMLMTLSACNSNSGTDVASLYSGNEGGSWFAGAVCQNCSR